MDPFICRRIEFDRWIASLSAKGIGRGFARVEPYRDVYELLGLTQKVFIAYVCNHKYLPTIALGKVIYVAAEDSKESAKRYCAESRLDFRSIDELEEIARWIKAVYTVRPIVKHNENARVRNWKAARSWRNRYLERMNDDESDEGCDEPQLPWWYARESRSNLRGSSPEIQMLDDL